MTAKELAAAAALVTTVLIVGAVTLQKDPAPTLDLSTARLVRSLDGGKAYLVEGADGGLFETAPCVRRRKGSAPGSCLKSNIDIGELNRFDRTRSSGPDCEPVACAVLAGEDGDGAEDAAKAQPVVGTK